jgi:hypothetical protein
MPNNTTAPTLKLLVSAKRACEVTVYRANGNFLTSFDVAAGNTYLYEVERSEYAYANTAGLTSDNALRVVSTDTISLYASNRMVNSSDANNVLPTAALGSSYMAMSYSGRSNVTGQKSTILIVATEDATRVKITPRTYTDSVVTRTVARTANISESYQMVHPRYGVILVDSVITNRNRLRLTYHLPTYGTAITTSAMSAGQTYLYTSDDDLTGSIVEALDCKKIAVFTGHQRTSVGEPAGNINDFASDHLVEQMLPFNSLGRKFVLIPTMDRVKDRYRVVAAENATTFTINGVSRTLNKGMFYEGELRTTPAYIEANQPLAVCIYPISMGAVEGNKGGSDLGDNSMIWVNPVEQTLEDIIFAALPTDLVKSHYVNILVNTADAALTTLDGKNIGDSFREVPSKPEYSYARIDDISANIAHHLKNPKGLSAYVYGYGNAEAYGYTAGSSVKDLTLGITTTGTNKEGQSLSFSLTGISSNISIISWQIGADAPILSTNVSFEKLFENAGCSDITVVYKQADNPCAAEQSITFAGAACIKPADLTIDGALEVCEGDTIIDVSLFDGGARGLGELRWYKDSTTSAYCTTSPISPFDTTGLHTYYISQVRNGQESDRVAVSVNIKPRPTLSGVQDTVICEGMEITLAAESKDGNLTWSDTLGNTLSNLGALIVSPNTTTTYLVTAVHKTSGCSIKKPVTVSVVVKPMPTLEVENGNDTTICLGQSVELKGGSDNGTFTWSAASPVTPSVTTVYTARAVLNGCVRVKNIRVSVQAPPTLTVMNDTAICKGQSVALTGSSNRAIAWSSGATLVQPTSTQTYTATVVNGTCSLSANVVVTVNELPTLSVTNDTAVCLGQSVTLNATSNGTVTWDNVVVDNSVDITPWKSTICNVKSTLNNCTTYDSVRIAVAKPSAKTLSVTACNRYILNDSVYTESGIYTQHLLNAAGCDSTLTLNLTVHKSTADTLTISACDRYVLNGNIYGKSGTYAQTLRNAAGCDSTLTLILTVGKSSAQTLTVTACDSYELNDVIYTTSGTHTQKLVNAAGCDSTLTLKLTIGKSTSETLNVTACDRYILNDSIYTLSGAYVQHLTNAAGCDSTLTLNLTVNKSSAQTLTETACDSYTLNDSVYTVSGTYVQHLTNAAHCDSTLTLVLTVKKSSAKTLTEVVCDSYTLNDSVYTVSGIYTQKFTNAAGCDSTLTLNLTVNKSSAQTLTETACDSYTLNDSIYTVSGIYVQHLTNAAGCDSTLTLNLTVNKSSAETLNITACDRYTLNDSIYTASGTYIQRLTNAAGCDSTLTLNLTVNPRPTLTGVSDTAICKGMLLTLNALSNGNVRWSEGSTIWNGGSITVSPEVTTTYTVTATSDKGCTVRHPVQVTVETKPMPTLTVMNDTAVCEGENLTLWANSNGSLVWNTSSVITVSVSNTYTVEANLDGCIVSKSVRVTVKYPSAQTLTETACDSFTLNDSVYTESGVYTQHLLNAAGCDSTLTLHLTVKKSSTQTLTEVVCDSYTLNGKTYTESGTYTQKFINAAGCDSTLTLILTVNKSSSQTLTEVACDSYTLNGKTYTESGTYTQKFLNLAGCDSTLTLILTVNKSSSQTLTENVCDSYTLNDSVYTVSGIYVQHLTNAAGCDSTLTLNLTVKKRTQNITGVADIFKTYGDAEFTLNAAATSGLPVSFAISAGDTDVVAIDGNRVAILGTGTLTVTAAQPGNSCYNSADTTFTINVARANQTITVSDVEKTYGDSAFYILAKVSSGLPITFTAPAYNGIVNVDSNGFTGVVGVGAVQVEVSQAGNRFYNAASATFTVTVNRMQQTITFVDGEKIYKTYGDADFEILANASSSLPLTYRLASATDVITLSGKTASVQNAGFATVEAVQEGNSFYAPATASIEVEVERAAQLVSHVADVREFFDEKTITLSATSTSGLPVSFEVPYRNGVVSVLNNIATIEGVGKIEAIAVQEGNRNYLPDEYHFTIEVVDVPPHIIIPPQPHVGTVGDAYCFTAVATGTNLQYQWFFNGAAIEGATDKDFCIEALKIENEGMYHLVVSNSAAADTSDAVQLSIFEIDEVLNMTKVYPNPTRGISTVENEYLIIEEITLRDGAGNAVYAASVNGTVAQFDATNAPSGIYFLFVQTNKGMIVRRVMKIF